MAKKTNTNTPLNERAEVDAGRKPYLVGKTEDDLTPTEALHGGAEGGTYSAMMNRTPYIYSQQMQLQHSQFKKTYAGDDFYEMEWFADDIELAGYNNPWQFTIEGDTPPGDIINEVGSATSGISSCSVVCNININHYKWNDDCSELRVYFMHEFATNEGETVEDVDAIMTTDDIASRGIGDNVYLVHSNHSKVKREDGGYRNWTSDFGQTILFYDIPNGFTIEAMFKQELNAQCPLAPLDWCTLDAEYIPDCCSLEWDSVSSDETAVQSSNATVVVSGGDGASYSWSVSGTDVTMLNATTTTPTNTVVFGASACGTASVTVVSCGVTSEKWDIRVTDSGTWDVVDVTPYLYPNEFPISGPSQGLTYESGYPVHTIISGKWKVEVVFSYHSRNSCYWGLEPDLWRAVSNGPITGLNCSNVHPQYASYPYNCCPTHQYGLFCDSVNPCSAPYLLWYISLIRLYSWGCP